tara:strand:+ start:875 stop:1081 length:207 start_codon:yes stop_codon:yes gene_type:complete
LSIIYIQKKQEKKMKKPRIEDMTDKYEVLNPDGSFRCYGSKTFDKLREEWSKEKEKHDNRDCFPGETS